MDDVRMMGLKDAQAEIGNRVYAACLLYEELEGVKLIHGNGHHMAQKVAAFAAELMAAQWIEKMK